MKWISQLTSDQSFWVRVLAGAHYDSNHMYYLSRTVHFLILFSYCTQHVLEIQWPWEVTLMSLYYTCDCYTDLPTWKNLKKRISVDNSVCCVYKRHILKGQKELFLKYFLKTFCISLFYKVYTETHDYRLIFGQKRQTVVNNWVLIGLHLTAFSRNRTDSFFLAYTNRDICVSRKIAP